MSYNKIFISRRGRLGDVIIATPIFRAIKKAYPQAKMTLMVDTAAVVAVRNLPFFDEVLLFDRHWRSQLDIIRKIWRFDAAFLLDGSYKPALLAYLARIPLRIGEAGSRKGLLTCPFEPNNLNTEYEPVRLAHMIQQGAYIDFANEDLEKLEISPLDSEVRLSVESLFSAKKIASDVPIVVIAPFTGWEKKEWPLEKYQQLITLLNANFNVQVVLVGTCAEKEKATSLSDAINLVGDTTFLQMAEIIRRSSLVVGSCSGHMHVAAALNIPTVILYGPSSKTRWAPRKKCITVSLEMPCSPCTENNPPGCEARTCMTNISVESVFSACSQQLRVLKKDNVV